VKLLQTLMAWARLVCSMVRPPTVAQEDDRRLSRERTPNLLRTLPVQWRPFLYQPAETLTGDWLSRVRPPLLKGTEANLARPRCCERLSASSALRGATLNDRCWYCYELAEVCSLA
jgi:hypothetical protein